MSWKDNASEHSRVWRDATRKIRNSLSAQDQRQAFAAFSMQHEDILDKELDKEAVLSIFNAWLFACFLKDNTPLVPWFFEHYGEELTPEEREVLDAAHESWFGAFRVENQTKDILTLAGVDDREFAVETVDMTPMEKGTVLMARLFSKGVGRWFSPARMIVADSALFERLQRHRRFTDSYYNYLSGFFKYLHEEQRLSEATADRHADNVTVLTMFLDEKPDVDSFKKVTPQLLAEFKDYCEKYIHPKPVMHKMYYSLYWFYSYLEDKHRSQYNKETAAWLAKRI